MGDSGLLEIAQMNHGLLAARIKAHTQPVSVYPFVSVCMRVCFFDNAIMGSVSRTQAAVDNTQASWSCCLSASRLAGGWLDAMKTPKRDVRTHSCMYIPNLWSVCVC